MKRSLLLLTLVACGDPPPLTVKYSLTKGPSEVCYAESSGTPAISCADINLPCASVLSIRILSPSDPSAPYISVCKPVTGRKDLCSIAAIDLPQPVQPIPEQTLEVQVAVYALSSLAKDADSQPICPTTAKFSSSDNLPIPQDEPCVPADDPTQCPPQPAIGGRAYYRPGDTKTVVALGCNSRLALGACNGDTAVAVTATVIDFDTEVSVAKQTADVLSVAVGEPSPANGGFALNAKDTKALVRTVIEPVPGWSADVMPKFIQSACVQVFEVTPGSTATLVCKQVPPSSARVDLKGVRVAKQTLAQIIKALDDRSLTDPPFTLDKGLVIGIVIDHNLNPVPGFVVSTSGPGTVDYLSADRTRFVTGGTSPSGIFLSTDAPYGTLFSTSASPSQTALGFGGLVSDKVTMVVLQLPDLSGQ